MGIWWTDCLCASASSLKAFLSPCRVPATADILNPFLESPTQQFPQLQQKLFASLFTHSFYIPLSWFTTSLDFHQCCWNFLCSAQSSPVSYFPKHGIAVQPITWWVMYLLHLASCWCRFWGQTINVSLGLLLRTLLPCQPPHSAPPWLLPHSVACHI